MLWKANLSQTECSEQFNVEKMKQSIQQVPAKKIKHQSGDESERIKRQTELVKKELHRIRSMVTANKENREWGKLRASQEKDMVCSTELNKRLDQVESSILGIYKTLNLLEKMTEKNSQQLKHIIELCNKRNED